MELNEKYDVLAAFIVKLGKAIEAGKVSGKTAHCLLTVVDEPVLVDRIDAGKNVEDDLLEVGIEMKTLENTTDALYEGLPWFYIDTFLE
jgi:hypothetical protein